MVRSLNSGVSGLQQFQGKMDVIGNNIANVNTVGFKAGRAEFSEAFSQTLRESTAGLAGGGNTGIQIGQGVQTAAVSSNYTAGNLYSTGLYSDLAISGDGFFVVRDPVTDTLFATRSGDFTTDNQGYLITSNGCRLQGFADSGLTTRGDVQINSPTPGVAMQGREFTVKSNGQILVSLADNTQAVRGQVLLQQFTNPQALVREGGNLFSGLDNAGPLAATSAPQTNGLGSIQQYQLEASNVDLTNQFADLIATQRSFQASARIITSSDELLQEVVNLKR